MVGIKEMVEMLHINGSYKHSLLPKSGFMVVLKFLDFVNTLL